MLKATAQQSRGVSLNGVAGGKLHKQGPPACCPLVAGQKPAASQAAKFDQVRQHARSSSPSSTQTHCGH